MRYGLLLPSREKYQSNHEISLTNKVTIDLIKNIYPRNLRQKNA